MAADAPSVEEIVEGLRGLLKVRTNETDVVIMPRAHAEAIVSYFDDLSTFAQVFAPRSDRT